MKKIVKAYNDSINNNIKDIKNILKDFNIADTKMLSGYRDLLSISSHNISQKWLSGRKYIRTYFVQKAFSKYYPKKYLEFSLTLDAMVNILDDFYDELMDKEQRSLCLLEFLRVFSLYNYSGVEKKIQKDVAHYFNKLIVLAVAEGNFLKLISQEKNKEKIVEYSATLLLCRSMDIDIFNEIAMADYNTDQKKKQMIIKMGRLFRAINILKKDVKDIEYDKKNNMTSVVTHIVDREDLSFSDYIDDLLLYLFNGVNDLYQGIEKYESEIKHPTDNFYKMISKDIEETKKLAKKY